MVSESRSFAAIGPRSHRIERNLKPSSRKNPCHKSKCQKPVNQRLLRQLQFVMYPHFHVPCVLGQLQQSYFCYSSAMRVAIRSPADNDRGPRYMEKALAAIHQTLAAGTVLRLVFCDNEGGVGLFVQCPDGCADLVTTPIVASYPNCSVDACTDDLLRAEACDESNQSWFAELALTPDLFPILRHSQFEDLQSHGFADPIDSLLAVVQPVSGWRCRIEIALKTASRKRRRRARWVVSRLDRPFFREHERLASVLAEWGSRPRQWLLARLLGMLAAANPMTLSRLVDTSAGRHHEREATVQSASDKIGGHLFEARVYLVVSGPPNARDLAKAKLRTMAGAFGALTLSRLATFRASPIHRGEPSALLSHGFLLSHEELATMFHPPTVNVRAGRMQTTEFTELEAPAFLPSGKDEGEAVVGVVKHRSDDRVFGIAHDDRRRHAYIVGKTGMGKTSLVGSQMSADIGAGHGVCLIDPHGDLADAVLRAVPNSRTNETIVFDVADPDFAVGFNPLACCDPAAVDRVTSGVVSAFKKLHDSWGPRLEDTLRNAVFAVVEQGGTLLSLLRLVADEAYRNRTVAGIRDEVVRSFWMDEFAHWNDRYRTEAAAAIQNKIRPFLTNRQLRAIVSQEDKSLNLRRIMDDGQVLIVNLSKGRIGDDNATLLGSLLVTAIEQAALSRADVLEEERRDFYLYIDEFQNFTTGSFATILSEARKYRLNLTIAHQYVRQLDDETADAVFGNVGSMIVFQMGMEDAELLAPQLSKFPGQLRPQDLTNLPKYTAYARLLIGGLPSAPFSMQTIPPTGELPDGDRSAVVREASRRRHATPVERVYAEIQKSFAVA